MKRRELSHRVKTNRCHTLPRQLRTANRWQPEVQIKQLHNGFEKSPFIACDKRD